MMGIQEWMKDLPTSWWRHEMEAFSALLAICAANSPVNSPHKGQWRGALMFSLIYARINNWVNNREGGDLRCHRAHFYVTEMDVSIAVACCTVFFLAWLPLMQLEAAVASLQWPVRFSASTHTNRVYTNHHNEDIVMINTNGLQSITVTS